VSGPKIEVRRTDDIEAALTLGTQAGLAEMEEDVGGLEALWGAYEGQTLMGIVALCRRGGLDVVGWLAVGESHRGRGVGTRLLAELEAEACRRDATCLWATARAPGFFLAHGYTPKDEGVEPRALLANCPGCSQYGTTCTPRAVFKRLTAPS
jgi:N-acetylglutamate synthase-like GNAT family acetyltransferase